MTFKEVTSLLMRFFKIKFILIKHNHLISFSYFLFPIFQQTEEGQDCGPH